MNKFQIILRPVGWPVNERTNPHFDLEQTMVFGINTIRFFSRPYLNTKMDIYFQCYITCSIWKSGYN